MTFAYKYLIGSTVISLGIGVLTYFYLPLYSYSGFDKALEGMLLLSSIGLGFYGACLSVLASVFNTKAVKEIMKDDEYRKEFIVLSLSTLLISFITVFTTIFYQVFLENKKINDIVLNVTNSIWVSSIFGFLLLNLLFILMAFMIFFSNDT